MKYQLWFLIFIFFFSCVYTKKSDIVIQNANILNEKENYNQALAIHNNKIIEISADRQILNKYRANQYIDAKKQILINELISNYIFYDTNYKSINEIINISYKQGNLNPIIASYNCIARNYDFKLAIIFDKKNIQRFNDNYYKDKKIDFFLLNKPEEFLSENELQELIDNLIYFRYKLIIKEIDSKYLQIILDKLNDNNDLRWQIDYNAKTYKLINNKIYINVNNNDQLKNVGINNATISHSDIYKLINIQDLIRIYQNTSISQNTNENLFIECNNSSKIIFINNIIERKIVRIIKNGVVLE